MCSLRSLAGTHRLPKTGTLQITDHRGSFLYLLIIQSAVPNKGTGDNSSDFCRYVVIQGLPSLSNSISFLKFRSEGLRDQLIFPFPLMTLRAYSNSGSLPAMMSAMFLSIKMSGFTPYPTNSLPSG